MSRIVDVRCFNHPQREAAARCVRCRGFFCRECITEHHKRMICARCLLEREDKSRGGRFFPALYNTARLALGFFILWLVFFNLGRLLLLIPTEFHEGTFWSSKRSAE
jgi:hypothetical protein